MRFDALVHVTFVGLYLNHYMLLYVIRSNSHSVDSAVIISHSLQQWGVVVVVQGQADTRQGREAIDDVTRRQGQR